MALRDACSSPATFFTSTRRRDKGTEPAIGDTPAGRGARSSGCEHPATSREVDDLGGTGLPEAEGPNSSLRARNMK